MPYKDRERQRASVRKAKRKYDKRQRANLERYDSLIGEILPNLDKFEFWIGKNSENTTVYAVVPKANKDKFLKLAPKIGLNLKAMQHLKLVENHIEYNNTALSGIGDSTPSKTVTLNEKQKRSIVADKQTWKKFMKICREKGVTTCNVLNSLMLGVIEGESAGESGRPIIVNLDVNYVVDKLRRTPVGLSDTIPCPPKRLKKEPRYIG